jgi:signal transduction histidine kinase
VSVLAPADRGGQEPNPDELASFGPAIVNVRWATTAVATVLASHSIVAADWPVVAATVLVVANTVLRSRRPLTYTGSPADQAMLVGEALLFWVALAATGFWQSPLVIASSAVLVVSGFAGGFRLALRLGAALVAGLTIVAIAVAGWSSDTMATAVQWGSLLLLTGMVAGYGRRVSGEATRRHSATLDRLCQLSDANTLLFNLHRLAQTLPASLDQTEVLESSMTKLGGLVDFDRAGFLLYEETDRSWSIALHQGLDINDGAVEPHLLPDGAKAALSTLRAVADGSLDPTRPGLNPRSGSGLYAPLTTRDRLVGLVVVESDRQGRYDERDRRTLQGFVEPMALAVDNARWFRRLRRTSVDEERSRIARELHDRIGQSLAGLGFDADRLVRHHAAGDEVGPELDELRNGVRAVTAEVRDALYDLRADVAEDKDLERTIDEFATRVSQRSSIQIDVDTSATARLPIRQEREMWRIAQEALINVERHAEAKAASVTWRCSPTSASLTVVDDGCGMAAGNAGRVDSYGIVGMRERANNIGAALEIQSKPGEGTTVRCHLNLT